MTFAEKLKALMGARGLTTQDELAAFLGIKYQQQVSPWLGGKVPGRKNLDRIAKAFGVTIDWLTDPAATWPIKDMSDVETEALRLFRQLAESIGSPAKALTELTRFVEERIRYVGRPTVPPVMANQMIGKEIFEPPKPKGRKKGV